MTPPNIIQFPAKKQPKEPPLISYTNFKGKTYYLHVGKTKTGKQRYTLKMSNEGDLLNKIPDGYEIYENPNAQVFLRKIPKKIVTDDEVRIVETGVNKYSKISHVKVDIKKDAIILYAGHGLFPEMPDELAARFGKISEEMQNKNIHYAPEIRFVLYDKQSRLFTPERYCYKGSIDDWIMIGTGDGDLKSLIKMYAPHLGQESFYELM
jgi:hypothetical protein